MITLDNDSLVFSFPAVHRAARLTVSFKRTLRIPDDGKDSPLPPGLGSFPLRHGDDYATVIDPAWVKHGGVMLPMRQSEAMWLCFDSDYLPDRQSDYPFAIKIATGKINAVSGRKWSAGLHRRPSQDYVVALSQPWLDGYCVEKGVSSAMGNRVSNWLNGPRRKSPYITTDLLSWGMNAPPHWSECPQASGLLLNYGRAQTFFLPYVHL